MLNQLREQANAESFDRGARLVPGLVLIKAPVGVARGLAYIKAPAFTEPRIMQENDINRVTGARFAGGCRPQAKCRSLGFPHPLGMRHAP